MSTWADKLWLLQIFQQQIADLKEKQAPIAEEIALTSINFEEKNVQAALEALQLKITALQERVTELENS